ncbi:MAG TPA: MgtC/SapB family protein [Anaerolineales bacterium]|nr:MgtC/SapB family protein [Anaerolineales bacterium]
MEQTLTFNVFARILLSILVGGAIGFEREFHDKAAGFRTLILISLGSTLFTLFSDNLTRGLDHSRVAAQIVSGVGFLGAGVILRNGGRVFGLTTAATIWLTAALGMGIGAGEIQLVLVVTLLTLVVLWGFPLIEGFMDNIRDSFTYEVTIRTDLQLLEVLEKRMAESGLHIKSKRHTRSGDSFVCSWKTTGSPSQHEKLIKKMLADSRLDEFRY